ncbi:holo-ACP synthase [Ligilactobacillus equi]|nr:holo-ACP synthase [Ligilactobacillus equi]KRL79953.1 holo-(acyl-carrier-protein) synthase [Ligilactobacillus equi DSM 15833 = JCM 10991]
MIVGLGIDITEIERIEVAQAKRASFAKKVLTPQEYEIFLGQSPKRQGQYLAGRFSVKEAYAKALGTGIGSQVSFQDLEIENDDLGRPFFTKHPRASQYQAWVSISHTDSLVMTEVILERRQVHGK